MIRIIYYGKLFNYQNKNYSQKKRTDLLTTMKLMNLYERFHLHYLPFCNAGCLKVMKIYNSYFLAYAFLSL